MPHAHPRLAKVQVHASENGVTYADADRPVAVACRHLGCGEEIATTDGGQTWRHVKSGRSACFLNDLHASTKAQPR